MLETDFKDGIFTLQINRPEARNALNRALRHELASALAHPPEGTRLVVLKGTNEAFCAGQDLSEFDEKSDVRTIMQDEYWPILEAVDALDVPMIALVEGACAGAGVSLALAADIVLASKSAFFQIAFCRIGLVPDILVSHILPRLIGQARAQAMALTGERIEAERAERWGMIWKSFDDADFIQASMDLTSALAQGPTLALGMTRNLLRQSANQSAAEQFALETDYQARAARSQDFAEGLRAFLEKRNPKFEGR